MCKKLPFWTLSTLNLPYTCTHCNTLKLWFIQFLGWRNLSPQKATKSGNSKFCTQFLFTSITTGHLLPQIWTHSGKRPLKNICLFWEWESFPSILRCILIYPFYIAFQIIIVRKKKLWHINMWHVGSLKMLKKTIAPPSTTGQDLDGDLHIHNHKTQSCHDQFNPEKVRKAVPEANLMCAEQTFALQV